MKLKHKFTIIVAVTIVQIIFLVFMILNNSSQMQKMKNYQYTQAAVEADLGSVINMLNKIDYWGFEVAGRYEEFSEKTKHLTDTYAFVFNDDIIHSFSDKFIAALGEQSVCWNTFQAKFSMIQGQLKSLEAVPFSSSELAEISANGIRASLNNFPDNENFIKAFSILENIHKHMATIFRSEQRLAKLNAEAAIEISVSIAAEEKASITFTIILTIVSCLILVVLILIVTRGITSRIIKIRDMTSVLAKKDFTTGIKPEGSSEMKSLMKNINNMVNQINDFFIVVKTTASKAISSGYTINDSANSTAAATSTIDTNLAEINKEFEEITRAIQLTIEAISDMNNHVEVLVENNEKQTTSIEESNNAVNGAATTLEYINQMAMERTKSAEEMHSLVADGDSKISQTSAVLNNITGQLDKVREIVTIINKVSAKTNLLSMNAGIEAVHAGEAGKGFGVVAGEIRSLAEETSKNAVLIEGVVKNIVDSVSEANSSSAAASTAFIRVRDNADQIIKSLQEITAGVGSIDSQMHQIKDKSEETACAADEINTYCTNLAFRQKEVSAQVDSMNELFLKTKASILEIKKGTVDIVNRVTEVRDSSKNSYKNMTDLENVLEEFKTKTEVDDIVDQVDEENAIKTVISENLQDFDGNIDGIVGTSISEGKVLSNNIGTNSNEDGLEDNDDFKGNDDFQDVDNLEEIDPFEHETLPLDNSIPGVNSDIEFDLESVEEYKKED